MYSNEDLKAIIGEYKELWHNAFGDSEEFIDFYFRKKLNPENLFTIVKEGHLVSALLAVPYFMTLSSSDLSKNSGCGLVRVAYLTGVATKEEERGKGYMQQLMNQTITELQRRSYAMVSLIIQNEKLYSFYAQFGFTPIVKRYESELLKLSSATANENVEILTTMPSPKRIKELYNCFNTKMLRRPYSIQHDFEDFKTVLEEIFAAGKKIYFPRADTDNPPKEGKVCGMAKIFDKSLSVRECYVSLMMDE